MEYICQYGNCHKTDTPILVSYKGGMRHRYCCHEHAAAGLIHESTRDWEGSRAKTRNTIEAYIEAFRIDRLCPRKEEKDEKDEKEEVGR